MRGENPEFYTLNSFARNLEVKGRRIREEILARKRSRKHPRERDFFCDLRMFLPWDEEARHSHETERWTMLKRRYTTVQSLVKAKQCASYFFIQYFITIWIYKNNFPWCETHPVNRDFSFGTSSPECWSDNIMIYNPRSGVYFYKKSCQAHLRSSHHGLHPFSPPVKSLHSAGSTGSLFQSSVILS